jgi:hypothetical protein
MLENSKVILSKNIKVDREMKNVLSYTPTQLINLMADNTHLVASDDHCSFIRERGTLQIDIDYSRVLGSNYMAYQNSDYSNKWFFCWIDEVLYKGNNNTEIVFTVDPFETFYSDLDFENAYVIREHVNDDTIGANTIPENLETGDPIQEGDTLDIVELRAMNNDYYVAIETDAYPRGDSYVDPNNPQIAKFSGITQYNKVVSGHEIIITQTYQDTSRFISRMNKDDAIDFIKSMFIVPSGIFGENDLLPMFDYDGATGENIFHYYKINPNTVVKEIDATISKSYTFTGYSPVNNKCKVYPYNYMLISNNVGQDKILKYEDFSTSNCPMTVYGCLTVGGSYRLIPKNYRNIARNDGESLSLGKYPTCAWTGDAYTNWLSQQSVNQYAESGSKIIQGAGQGAMVGGTHGALAMARNKPSTVKLLIG